MQNASFKHNTCYHSSYANTGLYQIICTNLTFRSGEDKIHDKEELEILDPLQGITLCSHFFGYKRNRKKVQGHDTVVGANRKKLRYGYV